MTKDEAILEIQRQDEMGIHGFQVLSMCDDDIDAYADEELKAKFEAMTDKQKAKLLSLLMDEMYDTFEEGDNWGFGNLFRETMDFIDEEERRDEIIGQAEME